MKALSQSAVRRSDAAIVMQRDSNTADTLVRALVAEGLVVCQGELLQLP